MHSTIYATEKLKIQCRTQRRHFAVSAVKYRTTSHRRLDCLMKSRVSKTSYSIKQPVLDARYHKQTIQNYWDSSRLHIFNVVVVTTPSQRYTWSQRRRTPKSLGYEFQSRTKMLCSLCHPVIMQSHSVFQSKEPSILWNDWRTRFFRNPGAHITN